MSKIIVYGAGGHAKVLLDIVERMGQYEILGLIDDGPELTGQEVFGHRVLGGREVLAEARALGAEAGIAAIGDNRLRGDVASRILDHGLELLSAIHPSACISRGVHVGPGCAIMAHAVVNADASLGPNVIVNTGATVDHDCVIGDCVHLSPGVHLAGGVAVGPYSHLGTGVVVTPNVRIGSNVKVNAGAVVIRDIPDGVTVGGGRARGIPGKS